MLIRTKTSGCADSKSTDIARFVVNGRFLSQRPTGVQRVAREIVAALDRLIGEGSYPGLSVKVVAPVGCRSNFARIGCRYIYLEEAPGASGHVWEQTVLPRYVRGGRLICLGNSAPIATLLSSNPPAVMLHDQAHLLYPKDYSLAYRLAHRVVEAFILRRAEPILLVSAAERANLATRHPGAAARAVVVPNGSWSDDAICGPPRSISAAHALGYGLFVGSPTARKNIDVVLAVAVRLARDHRTEFKIVGPPSESLSLRIPSDVQSLVQIVGYVSDDDMPELYRQAAFLLYPSFYEASGLPPTEAMTFGCPVIVSDLPVLRERLGNDAIYCHPYDHMSFYSAAERLLFDPKRASALSRGGLRRVAALTWRSQASAIVEAVSQS